MFFKVFLIIRFISLENFAAIEFPTNVYSSIKVFINLIQKNSNKCTRICDGF